MKTEALCYECGGNHELSGARLDCIRHWKLRALQAENKLLVRQIYGADAETQQGMIDFKTMCETFRERADNWERDQGELGKIVASEIRCIVNAFEEYESEKQNHETTSRTSSD